MQRLNYSPRHKKYLIWTSGQRGNWYLDRMETSVLIKNFSQLLDNSRKKFSQGRSEHLFLTGEIINSPDLRKIILNRDTRVIYFPKKHDGFKVEYKGRGILDIEEFEGYDIYCGIRKYQAHVTLVEGYKDC